MPLCRWHRTLVTAAAACVLLAQEGAPSSGRTSSSWVIGEGAAQTVPPAAVLEVVGAGTAAVNGYYGEHGTGASMGGYHADGDSKGYCHFNASGKMEPCHWSGPGENTWIYKDYDAWWIKSTAVSGGRTSKFGDAYRATGVISKPPDTGWSKVSGVDPAPTLRFLAGCNNSPCKNGATCTANGATHTCACTAGWKGAECDQPTGCDTSPCKNGATCTADAGAHTCTCVGEWGGPDCDQPPCQNHNDCGSHGVCVNEDVGHRCRCFGGYTGDQCNLVPCLGVNSTPPLCPPFPGGTNCTTGSWSPGDCGGNLTSGSSCKPSCGSGVSPEGQYRVREHTCQNGSLSLAKCESCTEEKCAHQGTCLPSDEPYLCKCVEGRSGLHCEQKDPCIIDRPCQNGATCNTSSAVQAGYTCACAPGFASDNCTELITIWHTTHCCDGDIQSSSSCPTLTDTTGTMNSLRDAPQTQGLCSTFSSWSLTGATIVSVLVVTGYLWLYQWLLAAESDVCVERRVLIAFVVAVTASAIALAAVMRKTLTKPEGWLPGLGLASLSLLSQAGVAAAWHHQRRCCRRIEGTVSNRLWRGVMVPVLAVASTGLVVVVAVMHHHDAFTSKVAGYEFDAWWVFAFGLLVPALPMSVAVGRLYLPTHHCRPNQEQRIETAMLADNEIYRGDLFRFAQHGYAWLSGLLFPLVWIPYMSNELLVFTTGIRQAADINTIIQKPVTIVGVRALGPIVVTLNLCVVCVLTLAVWYFPAPETFSLFIFVGIIWVVVVALLLVAVTLALVWSLAETQAHAVKKHTESIEAMRTNMMRTSFAETVLQGRSCCLHLLECLTSWKGQTALSTVNHLASIGMFTYGIIQFSSEISDELYRWMIAGIVMSSVGLIVSMVSLVERKWPHLKLTPTDDSFRLACILKVALVMTKAMVVFLLAGLADKSPSFEFWETIVTIISFVSLAVLALMTSAFTVRQVWRNPELLSDAGVQNPHAFIVHYAISYLCCKFATLFFMAQGHLPSLLGCNDTLIPFDTTSKGFGMNSAYAETISCTLCYPSGEADNSSAVDAGCQPTKHLYYACSASCIKLFYSGGDQHAQSLQVFVLLPLLWLPFAVYSNNEVAQLVDGLWWEHAKDGASGQSGGKVKIGLSSSLDGYATVAPLVQAVALGCGTLMAFLVLSGGYVITVPGEMLEGAHDDGPRIQRALDSLGDVVTFGAALLTMVMVCNVLVEIGMAGGFHVVTTWVSSSRSGLMMKPLLGNTAPDLSGSE